MKKINGGFLNKFLKNNIFYCFIGFEFNIWGMFRREGVYEGLLKFMLLG